MERVVHGFEVAGVAILVVGSLLAFVVGRARASPWRRSAAYQRARQGVGRAILLGLEVLIIADIVLTITVDRTLDSALTLGLIVLVRTFLSFSLEIELEGTLPGVAAGPAAGWRRRRRRTRMSQAPRLRSWVGVPGACRQVRAKRRSRSPWASSRMPLTAPQAARSAPAGRGRPRGSAAAERRARAPRCRARSRRVSSGVPPAPRCEPAEDPQQAREHRRDAQQPTNTSGSTSPESRSRSSTSTAPTTAAMAAASPSRNPGRGRMARANRSVISPPVIQNRARKVTRRAVLRPATVMARARARATSPAAPSATSTARSPAGPSHPCLPCRARVVREGRSAWSSSRLAIHCRMRSLWSPCAADHQWSAGEVDNGPGVDGVGIGGQGTATGRPGGRSIGELQGARAGPLPGRA